MSPGRWRIRLFGKRGGGKTPFQSSSTRTLRFGFILLFYILQSDLVWAGQIHWTFGIDYALSTVSQSDPESSVVVSMASLQSYGGISQLEFQFGSAQTYFYIGGLVDYRSTTYDSVLLPDITTEPVTTLGYGGLLGVQFWKLKLSGYALFQDIYLISHSSIYDFTLEQAQILGARLDFFFQTRSDLDVIVRGRYAPISATGNILSGTEYGISGYIEMGGALRWSIETGVTIRSLETTYGTQQNQDIGFCLRFVLPLQVTLQSHVGGGGSSSSSSSSRSRR